MSEQYKRLASWQAEQAQAAACRGEQMFFNLPDSWYEPHPLWGCENAHLMRMYLKSELKGPICPTCYSPIFLLPKISKEQLKDIVGL